MLQQPIAEETAFKTLLHKASSAVDRNTRIACGDFNAMNPACGYIKYTAKGRDLCQDATESGFTRHNEPDASEENP